MENNTDKQISKTDKELIEERIKELEQHIADARHTGKTYRAINAAIDNLFNSPIGTQVKLVDTDTDKDFNELRKFANKFADRMRRDFPDTFFRITYPAPGVAIVTRTTETYQETAKKRLEQWRKKLAEMK